jgi:beta-lactam-binding protein with PASTA domain
VERATDPVTVPDVVGMSVRLARPLAEAAGLVLAQPDPDGPPPAGLTWPHNPTIVRQRPAPGTVLHRWGGPGIS